MQLTRLTIRNLRAIEHLDIDLSGVGGGPRRRVVLLGTNGSGKTTVLDAIAHALQTLGADGDDFGARLLGAGDVRNRAIGVATDDAPPPVGVVTIEGVLSSAERHEVHRRLPGAPDHGSLSFPVGGELSPLVDAALRFVSDDVGFRDVARATLMEARPPCVLVPAARGALEIDGTVLLKDVASFDPRAGCLSKKRERFALLAARLMLTFLAPTQADRSGMVARMWKALAKYFPELPRPSEVKDMELWFENAAGAQIPLSALSDGERAILLLFGEIALRAPKDGVVMIDEVEQHLHPRWQRAVLEGLPALVPSAQFIITTQSPYVATCAPDDTIEVGDWKRYGE